MIWDERRASRGAGAMARVGDPGRGLSSGRLGVVGLAVLSAVFCGLGPGCQPATPKAAVGAAAAAAPVKAASPSKVTGAVKESDLAKLELTEQAEQRLGIVTVEARRQPVLRAVSYPGDVMIPPDRLISVASPFLGTVEAPPGGSVPRAGTQVKQG